MTAVADHPMLELLVARTAQAMRYVLAAAAKVKRQGSHLELLTLSTRP